MAGIIRGNIMLAKIAKRKKQNGSVSLMKKKSTAKKATTKKKRKTKLTNARLLELASKRQPPQSWYDENFDGI
jgi:hypothetical protein